MSNETKIPAEWVQLAIDTDLVYRNLYGGLESPYQEGVDITEQLGAFCRMLLAAAPAATHAAAEEPAPIDMVLYCPKCGEQHIDEPDTLHVFDGKDAAGNAHVGDVGGDGEWNNPPHRSHLCHGCGHIWRPADVPTNGVAAVKTAGKNDSPISLRASAAAAEEPRVGAFLDGLRRVYKARNIGEAREIVIETMGQDFIAQHFAPDARSTPEHDAKVDEALGIILLPPIRVSTTTHELLKRFAEFNGVIVQAVVRDILDKAMSAGGASVAPATASVGGEDVAHALMAILERFGANATVVNVLDWIDARPLIYQALGLASVITDRVPNRVHLDETAPAALREIGYMVNALDDGSHGYRVIRDALRAACLSFPSAAAVQAESGPWRDAILDKLALTYMHVPLDESPAAILDRLIAWHVGAVDKSREMQIQSVDKIDNLQDRSAAVQAEPAELSEDDIDAIVTRHFRDRSHPDSYAALRATVRDAIAAATQPQAAQEDPAERAVIAAYKAWRDSMRGIIDGIPDLMSWKAGIAWARTQPQAAQAEPAAWAYEVFAAYEGDICAEWKRSVSLFKPVAAEHIRNLRPLYAATQPQVTEREALSEPMTSQHVLDAYRSGSVWDDEPNDAFEKGIRAAEAHHGINTKG
jgi:hypothetical protein